MPLARRVILSLCAALVAATLPVLPATADPVDIASAAPVLRPGATGDAVSILQTALGVPVTGTFDDATREAVVAFQTRVGLSATGKVGKRTWAAIGGRASRSAARAAAPPVVGGKICPTRSFWYGDGFGAARWHGAHLGMDMMGRRGTPLYAIEDGYVVRAGVQSNGALRIVMQGRSGSKYYYGHNSVHFVDDGDRVKAGDVIGLMGDTGSPGAVHLHFEYWKSGGESDAVDPEPLLRRICRD